MTTAIWPSLICPLANFAWTKVVSSRRIRRRSADETARLVIGRDAASLDDTLQMVAVCRSLFAKRRNLLDAGNACRCRALSLCGGDRSKWLCRCLMEALRRRDRARSASDQGRGASPHLALKRVVSL